MSAGETDTTAWTVARLLAWTREYFQRGGIESPRLCAEILLAHALGCQRIQLYTRFEEAPTDDALARYRALVKQAAAGHPIAYLTGSKEFFSLTFEVNADVLIPRPETEILVERTIDLVRRTPGATPNILDLGTGSGCIAVALARHLPQARIFASDVSPAAIAVARRNAAKHAVAERIDFRCGGLFEPWVNADAQAAPAEFDLIVSNPPYIATEGAPVDRNVREFEPQVALFAGPDGLGVIHALLAAAPTRLKSGGHLLLEMAFDKAPAVRALLAGASWRDIVTYRDGAGHERVVHARL
jgi:release factor glutamine methyltransferase